MVRLKEYVLPKSCTCFTAFQFQNGAIKRIINGVAESIVGKFQFQNGAIKSKSKVLYGLNEAIFQFQNGAIKSA